MMEGILGMILNAENVRMLVLLAFAYCGYMLLKGQMRDMWHSLDKKIDGVESSLNKKIDGVETSLNKKIDEVESSLNKRIDGVEASFEKKMDEKLIAFHALLKSNDFAHLHQAIEALTFTLEKNGFLQNEDKKYIDSRLDERK